MASSDGRIEIEIDLDSKKAKKGIESVSESADKVGDDLQRSGKKGDKALKDVGESGKKSGAAIKKGLAVGAVALGGLGVAAGAALGALSGVVEAGRELAGDLARLDTNAKQAGVGVDQARSELVKLTAITGEADSSVEALSNLMAVGFKDEELSKAMDLVSGAAIKFSDTLKLEGVADGLQETLATGEAIGPFAELLERSGASVDEFNAGLAKAAESGKQNNYVLQQLSKLGLQKTIDSYRESNKALIEYEESNAKLEQSAADLSVAFMPLQTILNKSKLKFQEGVIALLKYNDGFSGLISNIQKNAPKIASKMGEALINLLSLYEKNYPKLLDTGVKIVTNVIGGIASKLPDILDKGIEVIETILVAITKQLPNVLDAGIKILSSIIDGIVKFLPKLPPIVLRLITTIADAIIKNLPKIVQGGITIVVELISGLIQAIPKLITAAFKLVYELAKYIIQNMPQIIKMGWEIIKAIAKGIWDTIVNLKDAALGIRDKIFDTLSKVNWKQLGIDLVAGMIKGIGEKIRDVYTAASTIGNAIKNTIQKKLDMHSPSRWARDYVIPNLFKGFDIGVERNLNSLDRTFGNVGDVIKTGITSSALQTPNSYNNSSSVTNNKNFNFNNNINGSSNNLTELEKLMRRQQFLLT